MNSPAKTTLPVRIVGRRNKTEEERFAEVQRIGLPIWKGRPKGIEVLSPDGTWTRYERRARGNPSSRT